MDQYCLYHARRKSLCKKYEICASCYICRRSWLTRKGSWWRQRRRNMNLLQYTPIVKEPELEDPRLLVCYAVFLVYINRFCRAQCLCSGSSNPVFVDCLTADTPSIMSVTIYHSIRCNTALTASELANLNQPTCQGNCWQRVESADASISLEPRIGTEWVNYNTWMKASKSVVCWLRGAFPVNFIPVCDTSVQNWARSVGTTRV